MTTDNSMTEMNDDSDFESVENTAPQTNPSPGKSGTGLIALIVLLVLILVGGLGYWLYDKQQGIKDASTAQWQEYNAKLTELGGEIEESADQLNEVVSAQETAADEIQTQLDAISTNQTVLGETLDVMQKEKPKQQSAWVLEEVDYLLTIAQQRLSLARDVPTSLAAMQGADARLRELGNPNLNGIRETLIKEMNELREVEDADISGMVLYIADVTSRVESLPLRNFEVPTLNDMNIPSKEEAAQGKWKDVALSMWGDLVKMVEIKDQAVPDEILFDPELRYFLHQNLQLELTSAKLSILRRDSNSMIASLTRVSEILNRYFDTESASVSAILEQLSGMEGVDLSPAMPEITGSLNLLKQYKSEMQETTSS